MYNSQIASGAANTTAEASVASPADEIASSITEGTISAASANGPPSDAIATPANAHVPIGRSADNDYPQLEEPPPDEPLDAELLDDESSLSSDASDASLSPLVIAAPDGATSHQSAPNASLP
jgi:hypothetical protein